MSRFVFSGSARRGAAGVGAALAVTLAPALAVLLAPAAASAHFILDAPPNWKSQKADDGSPQKQAPCGNEAGGTETGIVTPFTAGETITVTIDETVPHGGHYRVALAVNDMSELPADYTKDQSGTSCQNDDMQANPVFPILADGMLEHAQMTTATRVPQSFQVTLPSDITCDHCVLQVREYMTPHTPTCYYHHCAMISISAATGGAGGMSSGGAPSAGAGGSGGVSAQGGLGGSATSMGGMLGQAGAALGAGGTTSSGGGAASGGRSGTAGAPTGSGGSTTGGGGRASGTGGTPGTGGAPGGGTGGTAPAAAGTSTESTPPPASDDSGGCGCRVPAGRGVPPFAIVGALGLGAWLARRRRR